MKLIKYFLIFIVMMGCKSEHVLNPHSSKKGKIKNISVGKSKFKHKSLRP